MAEGAGAVRAAVEQGIVGAIQIEDANFMPFHPNDLATVGWNIGGARHNMALPAGGYVWGDGFCLSCLHGAHLSSRLGTGRSISERKLPNPGSSLGCDCNFELKHGRSYATP